MATSRALLLAFLLAVLFTAAGCAPREDSNRPGVYRGGQYYDDAVHDGHQH